MHSLHKQFFGFHSLILFLKATTLAYSFNSNGTISQILGTKYEILLLPWKRDLTFGIAKSELICKFYFISCPWKISLRTEGDAFWHTLNLSVANICRFLVCIVTDLSCAKEFSEDDDLPLYNRRKHLSCRRLIVLFIIRPWNIKIRGQ